MQLGQILDQRIQKDKKKKKQKTKKNSDFWSAVKCLVVSNSFVTPTDCRLCEMKISPDILINKKWLNHQQFLASKCEWSLSTLRVTPHGDGWGTGGMQEASEEGSSLAQIAEVHMKGMNSVSPEACTFPYKEG